jgi:hypothetical protein
MGIQRMIHRIERDHQHPARDQRDPATLPPEQLREANMVAKQPPEENGCHDQRDVAVDGPDYDEPCCVQPEGHQGDRDLDPAPQEEGAPRPKDEAEAQQVAEMARVPECNRGEGIAPVTKDLPHHDGARQERLPEVRHQHEHRDDQRPDPQRIDEREQPFPATPNDVLHEEEEQNLPEQPVEFLLGQRGERHSR